MTEHTVTAFDEDLQFLSTHIMEMGGHAEEMVARSIKALATADREMASAVVRADVRLDIMQRDLDDRAILLIAKRQPMANDLRLIMGASRMASDIERIGDLAKNIARRVARVEDFKQPKKLMRGLRHLTAIVLEQLKDVLDAFANFDVDKAMEVWQRDDEIDNLYTSLFRELLTYMMEDPRNITLCTHLLFCAKNLERIGDHATNIAETIQFVVTGNQMEKPPPKDAV